MYCPLEFAQKMPVLCTHNSEAICRHSMYARILRISRYLAEYLADYEQIPMGNTATLLCTLIATEDYEEYFYPQRFVPRRFLQFTRILAYNVFANCLNKN